MRSLLALALLAAPLMAGCAGGPPQPPLQGELAAAVAHLEGLRDAEGRWPPGLVPLVVEAATAARLDMATWPAPVPVAQQLVWPAADVGLLGALRPLLAHAQVAAAAGDEATLARVRDRVLAGLDGGQFGDPALLNDDAFALLVLGQARVTWDSELEAVALGLLENQSADGGWSWAVGGAGETDMTGMVLAAVAESGQIHRVEHGPVLAFLASTGTPDGGHGLMPGGEANCDSTVWAIRAKERLGLPAEREAWEFLLGLQRGDGGFAYLPGGAANTLCTAEATVLLGMAAHREVQVPAGVR